MIDRPAQPAAAKSTIEEWADDRGIDDAGSLYPHRMTGYRRLRLYGRTIATTDYRLRGRAVKRFAHLYARAYITDTSIWSNGNPVVTIPRGASLIPGLSC